VFEKIRVAVWIVLILFVPYYLFKHADIALRLVRNVDAGLYVLVTINLLLSWISRAARDIAIYRNQGVSIRFWDLVKLNNRQFALNYLPMKVGTVQLAASLKSNYGLAYSAFAGAFLVQNILMSVVASIFSIAVILLFADLGDSTSRLLLGAFVSLTLAMGLITFTTIRIKWLPDTMAARLAAVHRETVEFSRSPQTASWSLSMSVAMFVLGVWRLDLLGEILDFDVGLIELVLFSAVSQLSLLFAITPGALGIREFFMGGLARMFGFSPAIGVLLSLSERLVALVLSLLFAILLPVKRRSITERTQDEKN